MQTPAERRTKEKRQRLPDAARVQRPATTLLSIRDLTVGVGILLATLVAYWPALRGGPVWDDEFHITAPQLRSLRGLWRIWFDLGATHQYYPLLHSAFWIEHRVWGDLVLAYHLANVVEHALAAWLVMRIVRRLGLPGGWLAALIFALHPVCVEAVAWISEQKSTLSSVFYLASALIYLNFDQTRRRSQYWWAFALFVLALLSKTVTAVLPAVLLVIFWWRRGRLDWRRDVQPLLPWFVVGAGAGLFTAWVEKTYAGAEGATYALTVGQRVLLAGRIICFYACKLLWPANLIFTYPRWQPDTATWWHYLYPLAVAGVGFGLWRLARRHRGPLAGFLVFCGTLFPVLGFLNVYPFRYSYVADHFQYLAALGIIVPVAGVLADWTQRSFPAKPARRTVLMVVPAVLAGLTWRQSGMYRDSETLYRATLARNPQSWMAHDNLGVVLLHRPGHLPEAVAEFQAALRINPEHAESHSNLGTALSEMPDRLPEAIAEYQTALRLEPNLAEAHNYLGMALMRTPGRLQEAMSEFQTALEIQPAYAAAHNNLGRALALTPNGLPQAIAEYQTAAQLQPDDAEVHNNLGAAFMQTAGKMEEAIAEFRAALRLNPELAKAHNNLGRALSSSPDRMPEAIAEYQAALRIQPDYAEAHNNLGIAFAQTGRLDDAVAEFQAALGARPDYVHARVNLGNALAQIPGRRQEALAQFELALQAQPDLKNVRELIKALRAAK